MRRLARTLPASWGCRPALPLSVKKEEDHLMKKIATAYDVGFLSVVEHTAEYTFTLVRGSATEYLAPFRWGERMLRIFAVITGVCGGLMVLLLAALVLSGRLWQKGGGTDTGWLDAHALTITLIVAGAGFMSGVVGFGSDIYASRTEKAQAHSFLPLVTDTLPKPRPSEVGTTVPDLMAFYRDAVAGFTPQMRQAIYEAKRPAAVLNIVVSDMVEAALFKARSADAARAADALKDAMAEKATEAGFALEDRLAAAGVLARPSTGGLG